ncbi:site-2 protease family protein [Prochlorococcus sp. MIT 1300]|uniref:site-2 protease family protein n=1 Tax=Prochlorococcus sp. MIT 1300 TaxID=3096218 RepID=UPI002A75C804|nr:site-2 protease family protein [Prochlorococcus sp. MIT 1300]
MRIRGIPLRVHPSWFLILVLFTWSAEGQISRLAEVAIPVWVSWGLGLITALLLFFSVLLHELGHSFVAIHEGVKVQSITLFLLGGVARVEKECSTPMAALRVAAAGPLVSLILAFCLLNSVDSALDLNPFLANMVRQLGSLNLVLALFNLLPGLPLDGGLILKAIVWQLTGNKRKGIQIATATGRLLSIFAIVLGIWLFIRGGGLGALWWAILGWFGLSASRSQSQMMALQQSLCDLSVGKALGRRFRVLEDDESLKRLSQLRLSIKDDSQISDWVLVCRSGRWVGYVSDQPLKEIPIQQWDQQKIGDHMRSLNELPCIGEKDPLWKAVLSLERSDQGRLLVFNLAGLPSGTLDRTDLGEAVLKSLGLRLPVSILNSAREQNIYPLGISFPQVVEAMIASGVVDAPN